MFTCRPTPMGALHGLHSHAQRMQLIRSTGIMQAAESAGSCSTSNHQLTLLYRLSQPELDQGLIQQTQLLQPPVQCRCHACRLKRQQVKFAAKCAWSTQDSGLHQHGSSKISLQALLLMRCMIGGSLWQVQYGQGSALLQCSQQVSSER